MEEINGDSVEHFTYHVSPRNASKCKGGPVQQHAGGEVTLGPTMATGQHEYAVEIALGQFSFVVDGKVTFSNNNATGLPVHDVPWCVGVERAACLRHRRGRSPPLPLRLPLFLPPLLVTLAHAGT